MNRPHLHVVLVDLVVEHGNLARFMPLMEANAAASLANEPGCLRFDICVDEADSQRIVLYEIYEDAAAFADHVASAHFKQFDSETKTLIASKAVRKFALARA